MYEKTLVPVDGSELTEVALPYAEELASRLKTEVALLQHPEENPESDIIPPLKFILYWKELLFDTSHSLVLK